jgi:acetyl-CoA carboxylase biotin carboxyl carrier protein
MSDHYKVLAPFPGTFYRRPNPTDEPFANVGDQVEVGQPVAIIEVMKMFSEVISDVAGRVVDFPIEEGDVVGMGDVIAYLDTEGAS